MVILMNKTEFIKELSDRLSYNEEECTVINSILEDNFFISKKNKDKIISEIVIKLNIDIEEATRIYDIAKKIMNEQIKNRLKHPFRNKD